MKEVTEARSDAGQSDIHDVKARQFSETLFTAAISKLLIVAENYPDLKADVTYLDLQKELAAIEDEIQMARRYYNGTVRRLNIMIQSFPNSLIACIFGYRVAEYFELDNIKERLPPAVRIASE